MKRKGRRGVPQTRIENKRKIFSFPNMRGASTNILMTQEIHHAFKETFICKYKNIGNDCPGKSQGTPKA